MFRRPFVVPWGSAAIVGMQRNLFWTGQNTINNNNHHVAIKSFALSFPHESFRCCSSNNNDNNNSNAGFSPSNILKAPVINEEPSPSDKKKAEDQVIEAALNTRIADLISDETVRAWNEIQQNNIHSLGSWLESECVVSPQTNNIIKHGFKRALDEIEDITSQLKKLRESNETEEKDIEKQKILISELDARLKQVSAISLDPLSPAALRKHFGNRNIREWLRLTGYSDSTSFPYNSDMPGVSIVFDCVQRFLRNHSLQTILRERYRQIFLQIHRDNEQRNPSSGSKILAGSSHRNTKFPVTGLLGRRSLFDHLRVGVARFRPNETKERLPLFTVYNLPRQGKTALLDWMGYDRQFLRAFTGTHGKGCPVFVLNMTFNALWPAPNKAQPASASEFAITQMKIRLLAAALTKFTESSFGDLLENKMIVYMLAGGAFDYASCYEEIVRPCLRLLPNIQEDLNPVKTILLFDEFTNIEPRLNSMPPQQFEEVRERIYSAAAKLIDPDTLVVVSGFTNAPKLATQSGRVITDLRLDPIVSSIHARATLPMRSRYFGMIGRLYAVRMKFLSNTSREWFNAPMAVYELAKSSPGVLGAILELGEREVAVDNFALSKMVIKIPFLITIFKTPSLYRQMRKVLQYKSFQFLPNDHFKTHPLLRTMQSSLVDAVFSSAAFTPGVVPDDDASGEALALNLRSAHIEPLFLAYAFKDGLSEFKTFMEQLRCYSNAVMDSRLAENAVMTEFGRNAAPYRIDSKKLKKTEGIKPLTSSLFENAVLTGILFQRQLRHSLLRENVDAPSLECSLANFLNWLKPIVHFTNNDRFLPTLCWNSTSSSTASSSSSPSSSSSSSSIHRFEWSRIPYPSLKQNTLQSEPQLCAEQLTFSLNSVHIPLRPESNPLADIIFHEQTSDGRLIQFWIDTKHSNLNPLPDLILSSSNEQFLSTTPAKTAKLIRDSLVNPLLQDPSCPVDHIVHIVITSWSPENQQIEEERDEHASIHSSVAANTVLGRLSSYSLFIVRPGDAAFENLVSEPIKLAMPLPPDESWTQKLPENVKDWSKYRAVKRQPSMVTQLSIDEFNVMTDLAFAEDCAMPLINSAFDAGFTGDIFKYASRVPGSFKRLPFGSWLEALGARPPSWNGKPFYDKKVEFQKNDQSIEFVVGEGEQQTRIPLQANYVKYVTENFVTIGHLFHNREDMDQRDLKTLRIWKAFFAAGNEEETRNLRFACGVLWNTTLNEWNQNIPVSTKFPSFLVEQKKAKTPFSVDHPFAKKSAREIIEELQNSGKLIKITDNAMQRSMTEVIQERVDKILKTII